MEQYFDQQIIDDAIFAAFIMLAAIVVRIALWFYASLRRRFYARQVERKINRDGVITAETVQELEELRSSEDETPWHDFSTTALFGMVFWGIVSTLLVPAAMKWFEVETGTSPFRLFAVGAAIILAWSGFKLHRDGPEEEIVGYDEFAWARDPNVYWFASGLIIMLVGWSLF